MNIRLLFLYFLLCLAVTSCSISTTAAPTESTLSRASPFPIISTPAFTSTPVYTITAPPPVASFTPSPTPLSTSTPTATESPIPTFTPTPAPFLTPSITPTFSILRAKVLEQANCRYGPGAPYLYKYGLYPGNNIEVVGRNEIGTWVVIQAIGGTNPCWVKASLLDIKGDVMSLAPAELPLPMSPYYDPLTGVTAERNGNDVIISWNPLTLRAGDDSLQYPYLVEAWLCQDGTLSFTPIGSWETIITVTDVDGCSEPSHARVYGVEKHGYTHWVEVPWPMP